MYMKKLFLISLFTFMLSLCIFVNSLTLQTTPNSVLNDSYWDTAHNSTLAYDTDWGTYAIANDTQNATLYENWTNSVYATSVNFEVKMGGAGVTNYTLTSANCSLTTKLQVKFSSDAPDNNISLECYNESTGWITLGREDVNARLYEADLFWVGCNQSLSNSTWASWADSTDCYINNTKYQTRTKTQTDSHSCISSVVYTNTNSTSCVYSVTSAAKSCQSTKATIFAAFALIGIFAIAAAAFLLIHAFGGNFDSGAIMATVLTVLGLGIILVIGYFVVSSVALSTCLI